MENESEAVILDPSTNSTQPQDGENFSDFLSQNDLDSATYANLKNGE